MTFSIIIPTYNCINFLSLTLDSVVKNTEDFEIIVVDNGSTDGSVEYVQGLMTKHSNIYLMTLTQNEGFSKAINVGLLKAQGSYIIWLNNDVLVTPSWTKQMRKSMIRYSKTTGLRIGLVGPATNFAGGRQQVPNISYQINNVNAFAEGFHKQHLSSIDESGFLSGFCLMMKREVFEDVGTLDEEFSPGGFEDNDYLLRANEKGWYGIIDGSTFIHHFGSQTLSREEFKHLRGGVANRLKFYQKWQKRNEGDKRLVAMYRVKDPDDHFSESLRKTSEFADVIVVLVDNPTTEDLTEVICSGFDKVKVVHISREPFNERRDRNKLIAMARAQDADWIIAIDDDEVFEDTMTREKAQQLMHPVNPHVKMYGFCWRTFFHGTTHFRSDGIFGNMHGFRMVKDEPDRLITAGTSKGFHCFVPGSLVTCLDENNNVIQRPIEIIKKGDSVLTKSGIFHTVNITHENYYEGKINTLKFWGGQTITCIPTHEIFTPEGKKSAKDMFIGDYVNTGAINKDNLLQQRTDKEMLLLGYFLGDGYINRGLLSIACNIKHTDRIQEIKTCAEQLGFNVTLDTQKDYNVTRVQCYKRKDLREEFLSYTKPKRLPLWTFSHSESSIGYLLRGLFLSDGFIRQGKYPIYTSGDKSLAYSIYYLLRSVDIIATVYTDWTTGFDDGHHIIYKVSVFDGESRRKFSELTRIDVLLPKVSRDSHGSLKTLQVKGIEVNDYEGPVYNLSVETDHSYVVEGVSVKNCGNVPAYPPEFVRWTNIRIKHYGYCTQEKCDQKYDFYQQADDERVVGLIGASDYNHLINKRMITYPWEENNSLTLAMTVKDEGDLFAELLECLGYFADEIVIGDNGTTNDSIDIARMYGAKIFPVTFNDNFSKLKNSVIEKAHSDWIFWMDGDESIEQHKIPDLRKMMDSDWDGYMFSFMNYQRTGQASLSEAIRLFRNIPAMRYTGRVHENFDEAMGAGTISISRAEFPLHHYGFMVDPKVWDDKLSLYQRLNEIQMKEHPKDSRAPFNLALHHLNEGNTAEATRLLIHAASLNPVFYQPKKELGLLYIRKGQRWLNEALELVGPENVMHQMMKQLIDGINGIIGESDIKIGSRGEDGEKH